MEEKKKKLIIKELIIMTVIIGVIGAAIVFNMYFSKTKTYKIIKANIKFGMDYCQYEDDWLHGEGWPKAYFFVITPYECRICGLSKKSGSSFIPAMCPECQELTNRCEICGKKLHHNKENK